MATGRPSSVLLDQGLDFATRSIQADRTGDLSATVSRRGLEAALASRLSRTQDMTLAAYVGRQWSGDWDAGVRYRWRFGR